MDYFYLAGIAGATCVLGAFFMHNFNNFDQGTLIDEWLNLVGAILLMAYAIAGQVWPFVVLNAVWALWSAKVLGQQLSKK